VFAACVGRALKLARAPAVLARHPARRLARRAAVVVLAGALLVWAIATITRAGAKAPLNLPTTTIVERPTGLHAIAFSEASAKSRPKLCKVRRCRSVPPSW